MTNKKTDKPHLDGEKRRDIRRKSSDRRQEIRFEPEKEARRNNPGRRESDHDPWFKHGV